MALDFNSVGRYDLVTAAASINNINKGITACWVWFDTQDVDQRIWQKGTGSVFHIVGGSASGTGRMWCEVERATSSLYVDALWSNFSAYSTGKWLFCVYVWDSAGNDDDQLLLVGDLITPITEPSSYVFQTAGSGTVGDDSAQNMRIANNEGYEARLNGDLACLAIYNDHSITASNFSILDGLRLNFRPQMFDNLVLYRNYVYGTGTQPDLSGNGNAGTLVGGPTVADHVPLGPPFGYDVGGTFAAPATAALSVTVNDSTHVHTAESMAATIIAQLVAAGSLHAHAAEVIPLTFTGQLVAGDGSHAHLGASASLIAKRLLSVGGGLHAHSGATTVLWKITSLLVAGGLHAHAAEKVAATIVAQLTAAGSLHAHVAGSIATTIVAQLVAAGSLHAHAVEQATLAIITAIVVADSLHSHTAESVIVDTVINLLVAGGLHAHDAESTALTIVAQLTAAGGLHAHAADDISIIRVATLVIDDVLHDLSSDNVILTTAGGETYLLVVEGGLHAHTAASVLLADAWKRIIIQGRDARTGRAVKIIGSYREI
jgi:hypothetical protein